MKIIHDNMTRENDIWTHPRMLLLFPLYQVQNSLQNYFLEPLDFFKLSHCTVTLVNPSDCWLDLSSSQVFLNCCACNGRILKVQQKVLNEGPLVVPRII